MTKMWTADDVLFAPVRACRNDGADLARDLLAAAGAPGSLDGVTPAQARVCAAEILSNAGDLDAALATADHALAGGGPGDLGPRERFTLAEIFAAAGDADRAVELAAGALTVGQVSYRQLASWIALVLQLAAAGRFDQALRLCDASMPGSAAPLPVGPSGTLGSRIGQLIDLTRQEVCDVQAETEAAGTDLSVVRATPAPHAADAADAADAAGAAAAEPPAWPAVMDGHLGWWPEPEYDRIIRQVPELGTVLGHPWRQHTSRTESALRASSRRGARGLTLAALSYADFVDYLTSKRADPGSPSVMTGFAAKSRQGPHWPPKAREKCWCGSGSRYRDCCGRPD